MSRIKISVAGTILSASLGHTNLDTVNQFYLSANHKKASGEANKALDLIVSRGVINSTFYIEIVHFEIFNTHNQTTYGMIMPSNQTTLEHTYETMDLAIRKLSKLYLSI